MPCASSGHWVVKRPLIGWRGGAEALFPEIYSGSYTSRRAQLGGTWRRDKAAAEFGETGAEFPSCRLRDLGVFQSLWYNQQHGVLWGPRITVFASVVLLLGFGVSLALLELAQTSDPHGLPSRICFSVNSLLPPPLGSAAPEPRCFSVSWCRGLLTLVTGWWRWWQPSTRTFQPGQLRSLTPRCSS